MEEWDLVEEFFNRIREPEEEDDCIVFAVRAEP